MITKQPNGLYAIISTIVEAPTNFNMTKNELHEYLQGTNQFTSTEKNVTEWLSRYEVPFRESLCYITNANMTQNEIDLWLKIVRTEYQVYAKGNSFFSFVNSFGKASEARSASKQFKKKYGLHVQIHVIECLINN